MDGIGLFFYWFPYLLMSHNVCQNFLQKALLGPVRCAVGS